MGNFIIEYQRSLLFATVAVFVAVIWTFCVIVQRMRPKVLELPPDFSQVKFFSIVSLAVGVFLVCLEAL